MTTPINPARRRFSLGAMTLLAGAPFVARAEDSWPNRPVTIVVPFSPGGNTDLIALSLIHI